MSILQQSESMIGGNLIEIAAGLAAFGTTSSLFTSVYSLKLQKTLLDTAPEKQLEVRSVEYGWKFNLPWLLTCLIVPILFLCVFTEIYESLDITDSAVTVLSLFWVYLLFMTLWVYAQYIFSAYRWLSYLLLAGALIVAIVQTGYIFVTLHSTHWYHYLIILFYVPPIVGVFANYQSNVYRDSSHDVFQPRTSPLPAKVRTLPSLSGFGRT